MKPSYEFSLMKGRALGAFEGFVDAFNWLFKFCFNLKSPNKTISLTGDSNDHYSIDIEGYKDAEEDTVPTKTEDGLEWKKYSATADEKTISTEENEDGTLALKASSDADANTVPVMKSDGSLEWKPYNEGEEVELTFRGTDGSSATGSTVRFAAADDTALTAHVAKSGNTVVVTLGLHWKT